MRELQSTNIRWFVLCVICLLLPLDQAHALSSDDGSDSRAFQQDAPPARPGVVIVKYARTISTVNGSGKTGIGSLDYLNQQYQVRQTQQLFPFLEKLDPLSSLAKTTQSLRRVYALHYTASESPHKVAATYAADPNVVYAEPHYIRTTKESPTGALSRQVVPNDSLYEVMDHLEQVNLPQAWEMTKGQQDTSVVVAVVDDGVEWRHPDLRDNVWYNSKEIPDNNVDDDENGFVDDVHGWNFTTESPDPSSNSATHGTYVAGVISGVTNNQIGVAGSSWNAKFMPVATSCPNAGSEALICFGFDGILYAVANGADIINVSWGGLGSSKVEQEIVNAALAEGSLIVASAGNAGANIDRSPTFPAALRGVLTVGATRKKTAEVPSFSNFGRSVDVFAPGVNINTTAPDSSYAAPSGTSFSTPLTSAIAALTRIEYPQFTIEQVREQVRVTSRSINAENPDKDTFLGQGLVDAVTALSGITRSSIRMTEFSYITADEDTVIESGETVQIEAQFKNYLAPANNVPVRLVTDDTLVTVTSEGFTLPSLDSLQTQSLTFEFEVSEDAPHGQQIVLYAKVEDDSEPTWEVIRLVVNPAQAVEHTSKPLEVSVTNEGNIGFVTFADPPSPGVGFKFQGRNLLFEGGLLVGAGPERVSDVVRNSDPNTLQDEDLVPPPGAVLELISPGPLTSEETHVTLVDDSAEVPIGVSIRQTTYLNQTEAHSNFIIFRYTITNQDTGKISNLHAGVFLDWDIDSTDASTDHARFNEQQQVGYVFGSPTPSVVAGTKLLTTNDSLSYRAIDNPSEIYGNTAGGFSPAEKWAFMTGGVEQTTLDNTDVSQLTASGPFSLEPGASVEVAFALIADGSEEALLTSAENAQQLWDNKLSKTTVDIEKPAPAVPVAFALETIYPNPTSQTATFGFQMGQSGNVTLKIYDVLGREVQTLVAERRPAGTYKVIWNGTNQTGRSVAPGLYLCRLQVTTSTQTFVQSRQLLLIR